MKQAIRGVTWLGAMLVAGAAMAAEEGASEYPKLTWGGQFRLRQETFDHVPIKADPPGETRGGLNNYMRFRTQIWGQFDIDEHIGVYGRLANEFRHYYDPEENTTWEFPDETVVDNLYLDLRKLLADESLSIRIGRQDLFYGPGGKPFGNGRMILEGTPKDGSRTIYFDAARLTWTKDKTTINLIGIYNRSDAELLINKQDRDITGYSGAYNDLDESGVILYVTQALDQDHWFECYYIYKHESEWENGTAPRMPDLYVNTIGALFATTHSKMFSSSIEAAGQLGERDEEGTMPETTLCGYMLDGYVKANLSPENEMKPFAKLGVTWYSGNDGGTKDDEGWNPLWGRYPQIGTADLMAYSYDADGAARWSNLTFFYGQAGVNLTKDIEWKAMVGQISACEADGPGGGYQRGLYAGSSIGGLLFRPNIRAKDSIKGQIVFEALEPGDYYNVDKTAYFGRWELAYNF